MYLTLSSCAVKKTLAELTPRSKCFQCPLGRPFIGVYCVELYCRFEMINVKLGLSLSLNVNVAQMSAFCLTLRKFSHRKWRPLILQIMRSNLGLLLTQNNPNEWLVLEWRKHTKLLLLMVSDVGLKRKRKRKRQGRGFCQCSLSLSFCI